MKIRFLSVIFLLLAIFQATAQESSDVGKVSKEVQSLIQKTSALEQQIRQLSIRLDEQKQQLDYFKEALDFKTAITKVEVDSFEFGIHAVKGSKKERKITIEGIVTNKGEPRNLQSATCEFIDPKGNIHKNHKANYGGESGKGLAENNTRLEDVPTNIPIRFTLEFGDIAEDIPLIKLLTFTNYFEEGFTSQTKPVIFQNLEVTWQ